MSVDYKKVMEDTIVRLSQSLRQRRKLDNEIARLQKMARWAALQQSDGQAPEASDKAGQSSALGLTEAISQVLRTYETWLSPVLVRDLLDSVTFDIGAYQDPLPSIHVTLKRLVDSGKAIRSKLSSGGTVYMWANGPLQPLETPANTSAAVGQQC